MIDDEPHSHETSDDTAAWGATDGAPTPAPSSSPVHRASKSSGKHADNDASAAPPHAEGLRFIRELGRGGLGSVWLAMQETAEFRRPVAVKLVRRGMDTEDILRRFALERQLLAGLEHPHIVRLYGAGSTSDGRPFFVMEYVDGIAIDRFCDQRRLKIAQRLELFVQICSAVQYAHARLVVHRDLKPSNIIVTTDGVVKLLDFGIAKLVDSALSPVHIDPTSAETRVLTPEYASPEQIRGQALGTASDIYTLGVVLFELLTGHRPYRLRTRLMREMERIVCEEEPQIPSTVVTKPAEMITVETSGDGATRVVSGEIDPQVISKARGVAMLGLRKLLRGDLDVITLRALAKSPADRYASVEALAADLQRHLRGEPIEARATSSLGRAIKFARRNRVAVGVSVLAAVAIVSGATSVYFAQRADSAEQVRLAQTELAKMRLAQVRELSDVFLNRFYDRLRALQGGAELRGMLADVVARQIQALTAQEALTGVAFDDPDFDRLLALSYRGLGRVRGDVRGESGGDYAGAKVAFEQSAAILTRLHSKVMDPKSALASVLSVELMRTLMLWADTAKVAGDLTESRRLLDEAEVIALARAPDASTDERQQHAVNLMELAELADRRGEREAATSLFERSIELRRANLAAMPGDFDALRALGKGLQSVQSRAESVGEYERALLLAEELLAIRTKLAIAKPDDARIGREAMLSMLAKGRALARLNRADAARETMLAACIEATERVERAPDSHECLSDRALANESTAQALSSGAQHANALERVRFARADLSRAELMAPTVVGYSRRNAYLGGVEARILARLKQHDAAVTTASASAAAFEQFVARAPSDMDIVFQAAIVQAILSNCASRAGLLDATASAQTRAEELLALMTTQARATNEPFVRAELDAID